MLKDHLDKQQLDNQYGHMIVNNVDDEEEMPTNLEIQNTNNKQCDDDPFSIRVTDISPINKQ